MHTAVDADTEIAMLTCSSIRMSFGGVPVLKGVDLTLLPGTVTALAGENGAGKSTLMKIASGQYRPDEGLVEVRGETLAAGNIRAASDLGVAIVPQELASIPELTVYENLFVGRELRTTLRTLNRGAMIRQARQSLLEFGVDLDPTVRMGKLPVGIRQIIEIVKATSRGARVLLLDEPTSAIPEREVAQLIEVVRRLRDQGVAILFTTHKMEEIRAMADRVVILRDGTLVADAALTEITDDGIVTAMIGRELDMLFPELPPADDAIVLTVRDLVISHGDAPISFTVSRGEIVGLAGLVGAGRTELIECIYGIRKPAAGTVTVNGRLLRHGRPRTSIDNNIAIVPEDRKGAGAVLSMSVLDNATLPRIGAFSAFGILRGKSRRQAIETAMRSMRLKSNGLGQNLENLSGGNQQKVVLGRWLTGKVDALLLDEPTRGVDIGARSEIYRIITELSASGMAVLMASSDMPEILSLSHRALVLRDHAVVAELARDQLSDAAVQDTIFRLASGQDTRATSQATPTTITKEIDR
ncbi:sugar ABC transporter ATP-binding protein [Leifsonia sp. Root227]|uniref:sugar ABC transporter ATP-binding protein n=1 Tax=Leifsonia sp. Root227 TaxID=1736496 RepID=UPI000B25DC68|nr:sugar ABC transporter ATP-binding protein [Leifsonia sp. Root227]